MATDSTRRRAGAIAARSPALKTTSLPLTNTIRLIP